MPPVKPLDWPRFLVLPFLLYEFSIGENGRFDREGVINSGAVPDTVTVVPTCLGVDRLPYQLFHW